MTVNELYMANCDWKRSTHVRVVDYKDTITLYEGTFSEMPFEIMKLKVITFDSDFIITR